MEDIIILRGDTLLAPQREVLLQVPDGYLGITKCANSAPVKVFAGQGWIQTLSTLLKHLLAFCTQQGIEPTPSCF